MRVLAKPRVKRKTVATIAMLLACTCVACYLLAPLSRTLTHWLPFAATIYGTTNSPAADRGSTMALAVGNPAADPRARSAPAPASRPASSAPTPAPVIASIAAVPPMVPSARRRRPRRRDRCRPWCRSRRPGRRLRPRPERPADVGFTKAAPTSAPTKVSPTASSSAPTPTRSSSSPSAHFVDAPAPRDFAGRPRSPALMAQAQTCASTRTSCAGLQEVGPSPNCVYPAWVLTLSSAVGCRLRDVAARARKLLLRDGHHQSGQIVAYEHGRNQPDT